MLLRMAQTQFIDNGTDNNLWYSQEQSQNNSHGMGTVGKMAQTLTCLEQCVLSVDVQE